MHIHAGYWLEFPLLLRFAACTNKLFKKKHAPKIEFKISYIYVYLKNTGWSWCDIYNVYRSRSSYYIKLLIRLLYDYHHHHRRYHHVLTLPIAHAGPVVLSLASRLVMGLQLCHPWVHAYKHLWCPPLPQHRMGSLPLSGAEWDCLNPMAVSKASQWTQVMARML